MERAVSSTDLSSLLLHAVTERAIRNAALRKLIARSARRNWQSRLAQDTDVHVAGSPVLYVVRCVGKVDHIALNTAAGIGRQAVSVSRYIHSCAERYHRGIHGDDALVDRGAGFSGRAAGAGCRIPRCVDGERANAVENVTGGGRRSGSERGLNYGCRPRADRDKGIYCGHDSLRQELALDLLPVDADDAVLAAHKPICPGAYRDLLAERHACVLLVHGAVLDRFLAEFVSLSHRHHAQGHPRTHGLVHGRKDAVRRFQLDAGLSKRIADSRAVSVSQALLALHD